jgi:hypothetical protein
MQTSVTDLLEAFKSGSKSAKNLTIRRVERHQLQIEIISSATHSGQSGKTSLR